MKSPRDLFPFELGNVHVVIRGFAFETKIPVAAAEPYRESVSFELHADGARPMGGIALFKPEHTAQRRCSPYEVLVATDVVGFARGAKSPTPAASLGAPFGEPLSELLAAYRAPVVKAIEFNIEKRNDRSGLFGPEERFQFDPDKGKWEVWTMEVEPGPTESLGGAELHREVAEPYHP